MAQSFNWPMGGSGKPPAKKMAKPMANPADQDEMHAGEDDEPDVNDKPVHTEHHPEGHHTTTHESGAAHDSENLESLKDHLDKYFTEEEHEPSEGGEEGGY
jgi:hypothetical protein